MKVGAGIELRRRIVRDTLRDLVVESRAEEACSERRKRQWFRAAAAQAESHARATTVIVERDLRARLDKYWPALEPKLRGKLRIWVGEADDYFLNNAVHLLDDWAKAAKPASDAKITFAPRQGHNWRGLSERW